MQACGSKGIRADFFPCPHAATLDGERCNAVYLRGIFIPEPQAHEHPRSPRSL